MDLLKKGFKQDGVYLIDPDNQGPFQVFCDQTTNGGGWVVFQRRFDGSEDFYRNWSDYKNGFGSLDAEFWLGNEKIHRLTNKHQELLVELEDFENITAHARYGYFRVDSEEDWYKLHFASYSGTAGDALSWHNNMKFSTKDQDNDEWSGSCSQHHFGGWWYNECVRVNLHGNYTREVPLSNDHIYIIWGYSKRLFPVKSTSMKMRGITGKLHFL